MHALEAGGNKENSVKALKRLVDRQKGFSNLSPTLHGDLPGNFDELFQ